MNEMVHVTVNFVVRNDEIAQELMDMLHARMDTISRVIAKSPHIKYLGVWQAEWLGTHTFDEV